MLSKAPPWLSMVAVKLMPNFKGTKAKPRLRLVWVWLKAFTLARRSRYLDSASTWLTTWSPTQSSINWLYCVVMVAVLPEIAGSWYMLSLRTSSGSLPKVLAICSITVSMPNMPCGPPKPRKAVALCVLVLQRWLMSCRLGM